MLNLIILSLWAQVKVTYISEQSFIRMRESRYQSIQQERFKRPIPNLEKRVGRVPEVDRQYYSYIINEPSGRRISLEGYFRPRGGSPYDNFSFLSWEGVTMYEVYGRRYYIAKGEGYENSWAMAGYFRRFAIFTQDGRSFSQNIRLFGEVLTYASPQGRVVVIPDVTTVYILDPTTSKPIKASVEFPTGHTGGNAVHPYICGEVIPWSVKGQSRACIIQMTGGTCEQGFFPPEHYKPKYALIQW